MAQIDFKQIHEKYSREQTVLETEIKGLEQDIANYRQLAGISPEATYEQIQAEVLHVEEELRIKEDAIRKLLAQVESDTVANNPAIV